MEAREVPMNLSSDRRRLVFRVGLVAMVLNLVASLAMVAGLFWARNGLAAPATGGRKAPRVIYPEKTELDFEGARIEGEVRNPGELYFQRRQEEKFGSLVQPREHFRNEILRDLVQSR